jgi:hypothetical protein
VFTATVVSQGRFKIMSAGVGRPSRSMARYVHRWCVGMGWDGAKSLPWPKTVSAALLTSGSGCPYGSWASGVKSSTGARGTLLLFLPLRRHGFLLGFLLAAFLGHVARISPSRAHMVR